MSEIVIADSDIKWDTQKVLKHIKRYGYVVVPDDVMRRILIYSLKGQDCKEDHLDISQRKSIYKYLKDKDIDDPYIKQFMEETEKKFKSRGLNLICQEEE